jgi:hypothetical protein
MWQSRPRREDSVVNFNFFEWIRQGVKQSVLLGVSDAVGHLGTPREGDDVGQRLLSFVQESPVPAALPPIHTAGIAPRRKKLGRSLGDIQAAAERVVQEEE